MTDPETFLTRFRRFGATPAPVLYEDLFDPEEGTVLHPGMKEPLHGREVGAYMERVLLTLPGFGFEILTTAVEGDTLFVEARNRADLGGETVVWNTVYCLTLRGSRVLRGRAYFDRIPLMARLFPTVALAEAAAWQV